MYIQIIGSDGESIFQCKIVSHLPTKTCCGADPGSIIQFDNIISDHTNVSHFGHVQMEKIQAILEQG